MSNGASKSPILFIAALMAVLATALFFVVEVTPVFIIAYIFALLGIAMLCAGVLDMLSHMKNYAWYAAFPLTIWQYLLANLALSAVFVLREVLFDGTVSPVLFIILHLVVLAVYAFYLTVIRQGRKVIEKRDEDVKEKVSAMRFMQIEAETLARKFPAYQKELKQLTEAVRYSDPMSHPMLGELENKISGEIQAMSSLNDNGVSQIPERCKKILDLIAERNAKLKAVK